ncbi:TenA family transcriptional regulator [Varunaivibrio sulfuroxidans]|uniref:Heme oxygenase-like protein n=1 Tax=Varunaivibrio sulfuroxidans TaxID=1773489 RepID=A0A4R3JCC0_9PROT|nr:iron-containing redox enzyme family protein [Varunaivibrio sulfuroxidans]TCS63392.1 heme oxygenase-like protein [Varunaivibrio sulfuroxidans]WES30461.1 iron-containing redox enzyme family protein [Varunaivibrio sulfuroxidans]
MSFFHTLSAETGGARAAFLSIPLIRHTAQFGAPAALYAKYLAEAYHHVRFTVPLLKQAAGRCGPADTIYKKALAHYIEDERGHQEWILNDIRALGRDEQAVRRGHGGLACRVMVAYARFAIDEISPYALLGMVHVLEGMSVALAQNVAQSVAQAIAADFQGSPPDAFSYLTSHGALDTEHVAFFETLLDTIDDPQTQGVIVQAARDFYILFGDIFRTLSLDANLKQVAL